jgi:hypothetical protein
MSYEVFQLPKSLSHTGPPILFYFTGRPSIHITSTNTAVVEGQSHTIACSISNILAITDITWFKTSATGNTIAIVVN